MYTLGELEYQFLKVLYLKEVVTIPEKISYKAQQRCMDLNSFFDKDCSELNSQDSEKDPRLRCIWKSEFLGSCGQGKSRFRP